MILAHRCIILNLVHQNASLAISRALNLKKHRRFEIRVRELSFEWVSEKSASDKEVSVVLKQAKHGSDEVGILGKIPSRSAGRYVAYSDEEVTSVFTSNNSQVEQEKKKLTIEVYENEFSDPVRKSRLLTCTFDLDNIDMRCPTINEWETIASSGNEVEFWTNQLEEVCDTLFFPICLLLTCANNFTHSKILCRPRSISKFVECPNLMNTLMRRGTRLAASSMRLSTAWSSSKKITDPWR